jgi:O-antigen/teichoic acid export membrane protein
MILRFLGAQWLAVGFIGAVSFAISVLVARMLGPDQFGLYAIALSVGAIVAILADGGFAKLLQRERARSSATLTELLPKLPGLAYGHALLVILTLSFFSVILSPTYALTSLATIWFFGTVALNQFGLAILRGDGRLVRDASWQIGNRSFTAVCAALALLLGASHPWQVLMAQFIGASAFGFLVVRYLRVSPLFNLSPKVYQALLPFIWLDLATTLHLRVDMVLFQFLDLPKIEVGQYGVAYRLIDATLLLASPVGLILFRRFRQNVILPSKIIKEILPALIVATLIGMGLLFLLWFFSNELVALTYGPAYQGAGTLLLVLGGALVFLLPNGVLNQAALALGLERWFAISASIAALISIVGNLLLIPTYGIIAAAWMTVLTEAILGACLTAGIILQSRQLKEIKEE